MCTLLPKAKGKGKTILGISIGATTYGIALLKNHTLEDWQLKTVHGRWSTLKLRTILSAIERYCTENGVTVIALKSPDTVRSSRDINVLVKGVVKLAEKKQILFYQYTISELKEYCEEDNKEGLIRYVALQYPEMYAVLNRQKQIRSSYYYKMFEAVCVARYCEQMGN